MVRWERALMVLAERIDDDDCVGLWSEIGVGGGLGCVNWFCSVDGLSEDGAVSTLEWDVEGGDDFGDVSTSVDDVPALAFGDKEAWSQLNL